MLEWMRRGAKSWLAKGLILLLIASFAVWGLNDVFSFRLDSAVATVGGEEVTAQQLSDALERERIVLTRRLGRPISFADMREIGFDRSVLQALMRDAAFRAELDRLGLAASDEAVAEAITSDPNFQSGGQFSELSYRSTLAQSRFSPAEYEELVRSQIGRELVLGSVLSRPQLPPGLVPRIAAHRAERRGVELTVLPPERADAPPPPSGEALADHYAANQERYREPERRSGKYLHAEIGRLADELAPSMAEIEAAYAASEARYTRAGRRTISQLPLPRDRAGALAEEVRSGETRFEDLARRLGEDPGDLSLGTVTRDDLPDATADAVFAETEPGIVGPVQTAAGPVLIEITAVTLGGVIPLEEVRDRIAEELAQVAAVEEARRLANAIEEARATGASFEEIAGRVGLELRSFEGLARDGSISGGGRAFNLPGTEAFRNEVFAALDFEEREIVETPAGGAFVVLVEEIAPSSVPPLAEIRDRVAEDWAAEARLEALEDVAAEHVRALEDGESVADLAARLGLAATEHLPFPRGQAPQALPDPLLDRLFEGDEGTVATARAPDGSGLILAKLTEIVPVPPEDLAQISERLEAEIGQAMLRDEAEYFTRALMAGHPTEINAGAVEEVFRRLGAQMGGGG